MPATPTPGAGGAYLYDPATDSYLLVDRLEDPAAPAHPFEPAPEPTPTPPPVDPDEDLLP